MAQNKKNNRKIDKVADAPTSTAAEDMAPAATGKDTVTVALNRAQGIKFILGDGRRVEIFGNAVHLRGKEMGELPTGGAFGLTTIPAEDWEEISGEPTPKPPRPPGNSCGCCGVRSATVPGHVSALYAGDHLGR